MSAPVSETLLFIHLLLAFGLVASLVMQSAFVLGAPVERRLFKTAGRMEEITGVLVLVFGILLVIDIDAYGIFDGWIIAAIVIWALAAETGRREEIGLAQAAEAQDDPSTATTAAAVPLAPGVTTLHWAKTALTFALLAVMIWKPGA